MKWPMRFLTGAPEQIRDSRTSGFFEIFPCRQNSRKASPSPKFLKKRPSKKYAVKNPIATLWVFQTFPALGNFQKNPANEKERFDSIRCLSGFAPVPALSVNNAHFYENG